MSAYKAISMITCPCEDNFLHDTKKGAQQAHAPLKWDQLWFLNPIFLIRMLKNKAQIAQESIKQPWSFQGPEAGTGPLLKVRPPLNENPGSAVHHQVLCILRGLNLYPSPLIILKMGGACYNQ